MHFVFTNKSKKQFNKLDKQIQVRIKDKVVLYKHDEHLLKKNLKSVVNLLPITHRLRIGSYRLLLRDDKDGFIILKIGHRKQIYK